MTIFHKMGNYFDKNDFLWIDDSGSFTDMVTEQLVESREPHVHLGV